jgi:transcriptional regulator with XRE-family HTH domain
LGYQLVPVSEIPVADSLVSPSRTSSGSTQSNGNDAKSPDAKGSAPGASSGTSDQRRRELADFLRTRREKLKPEILGLTQGSRRRTPGLRREEVAELAGVGTTWYTWLEQARDIQPSIEVLRRLGQALKLNTAEMRHMYVLAGKAPPLELDSIDETVSPSMRRILDEALNVPALLLGGRWDVLAFNKQAAELFQVLMNLPPEKRNWLYYAFCAKPFRDRIPEWEMNSRRLIAEFRASLGESVDNPWVLELIETLKRESSEFAKWWPEHDVRDNAAVVIDVIVPGGKTVPYERTILRSLENPRLKILLFNPLAH